MKRRSFMRNLTLGASALASSFETARAQSGQEGLMRIDLDRIADRNQNRSTVIACSGMVCASQPLAAVAGLDMLKSGGNAIDAAIAANAVLSVVEPMNCGPGGDLFAICWIEKEKKLFGLNASGRAPYEWNLEKAKQAGLEREIPPYSPLAWSVPGCVSGWQALHSRFGHSAWNSLFESAEHYAEIGFAVSPIIARDWGFDAAKFPTLAETFLVEGKTPRYGDFVRNPDLARFYKTLAERGAEAFYRGEIADRIDKFSRDNGGYLRKKDLEDHEATWVDPVSTNYRGYDVWEIPPNGQGIAVLQILNILENFDIGSLQPNSPEQLHLFLEAKKLAYEDRAIYYADMDFAPVPLERLISKDYGQERARLIDPKRASTQVGPGLEKDHSDTVYLTAADGEGNMISLIQSTYYGWGSHIVPDRLGFPIQNRGTSFSLDPGHFNKLEPHKRPFHTIIPAFVTREGSPLLSFGVMGGDFQPQGHSQVLMNMLDFGMSPQQAGEQPRIEHGGSSDPDGSKMSGGGKIRFEKGFSEETRAALAALGHDIRPDVGAFGGYQAIWREEEPLRYFGGTDPRKDGCAVGW
jgi:gamma-glutamyltranspeptidase/glutathione hydrolase